MVRLRESEFKSENPGFNLLVEQGAVREFFCPSELTPESCADLFVPDLPLCEWHAPKFVHMLMIPSICHTRVGLTLSHSQWYGNTKTLYRGEKNRKS